MRSALEIHGALARGAFAVAVLVSLAVLFAPAGEVPDAPPGVDKVVHLVLFLALAVTGRWAGIRARVLGGPSDCPVHFVSPVPRRDRFGYDVGLEY